MTKISAVVKYKDERVSIHTSGVKSVGKTFENGFYSAYFDDRGNLVIKEEELSELHTPYQTKENKHIISTVNGFFQKEIRDKVEKLGFIHKLGVLLHGKAGTGKSSVLNYIADNMITHKNAIVLFCNTHDTLRGGIALAGMIRKIQDNPIVFIADEFDRYARDHEAACKGFLDGNESVSNSLFLAATNYLDKIPKTLKERPSRFRIVMEIPGIKDKSLMYSILKNMSDKLSPELFIKEDIEKIVKELESTTLDELKHIALDKLTGTYIDQPKTPSIGFNSKKEESMEEKVLNYIECETENWGFKATLPNFTESNQNKKPSNI